MLDEIDKLGRDFRGDPASALLEMLDPEQNNTFRDNYLDVPFDLSKVLFICTANMLDPIPEPLLDRMEIIDLSGYTRRGEGAHRVPLPDPAADQGERDSAGETAARSNFLKTACGIIVRHYTREAGVRKLEQVIGTVCRKQARRIAEGKTEKLVVDRAIDSGVSGRHQGARGHGDRRADEAVRVLRSAWRGLRQAATCCSSRRTA